MSDFIPFEIQMEIIKRVPDVTSLVRFRSVSKPWKSFIDSSEFISGFGARYTDPHRLIIRYNEVTKHPEEQKFICLVDDDNIYDALTRKQLLHLSAPSNRRWTSSFVGTSNGLFCLSDYGIGIVMVVLWNPCLRRSVGIAFPYVPNKRNDFGFGICPVTNDPTIVRISYFDDSDMISIPWQVDVFKLSLGVWKTISKNLPCPTIRVWGHGDVAIGKFIYWVAYDVRNPVSCMVMSFDLVTEKFAVVDIPDSLTKLLGISLSISKLRDSLVIYGCPKNDKQVHGVWKMEHDGSFTKQYSIDTLDYTLVRVSAFRMSGEPVMETRKSGEQYPRLEVYDPCSKRINNLGIHGELESLFVGSYMESLLLLNYSDGYVFD